MLVGLSMYQLNDPDIPLLLESRRGEGHGAEGAGERVVKEGRRGCRWCCWRRKAALRKKFEQVKEARAFARASRCTVT